MATPTTPTRDRFMQVLGVLGFIAILILGAWGIIRIVTALPSVFSGLGAGAGSSLTKKETLTVNSPTSPVVSGTPFDIAWTHTGATGTNYAYTAVYACREGLSLSAALPNGNYQTVPCNTPFNFTNAKNSLRVSATLTGASAISVPVTVTASKLDSGSATASGERTVSIQPKSGSAAATSTPSGGSSASQGDTKKPDTTGSKEGKVKGASSSGTTAYGGTTQIVQSARQSNPYGVSDLAVRIVSTGAMQVGTNIYVPNSPVARTMRAGMQFEIENVGDKTVPYGWTFAATLPLATPYTYPSAPQAELTPGSKIIYTLGFDGIAGYQNCPAPQYQYQNPSQYCVQPYGTVTNAVATVIADPYNAVVERTETNNSASAQFTLIY